MNFQDTSRTGSRTEQMGPTEFQGDINGRKSNGYSNGTQTKREEKSNDSAKSVQINHVIGDFGNYQFLIFTFKILIG